MQNYDNPYVMGWPANGVYPQYEQPYLSQQGQSLNPPSYLQHGWRADKGPQESNKSGFHACGHRVLLAPEEVEKKTSGGIVLVEKTVTAEENMAVVCTVLEIGHDCWTDKTTDYCQVGDRVLVGLYCGKFHVSPVDGKKYRFVMDMDIITPITGEEKNAK